MLVITLQVVSGFDPVLAGAALLPVTVLMLVLSPRAGELAQRVGPRLPMTVDTLLSAAGVLLLARVDADASYLVDVLPGVSLFGLGLSATVAPLTATVLAAAPVRHAGVASGVNNAVARTAGLLVVAALPALVALPSDGFANPTSLAPAYSRAMVVCALLLAAGAVVSLLLVRLPTAAAAAAGEHAGAARAHLPDCTCRRHCAVAGTPLEPDLPA
jgi:hypothetical protein